MPYKVHTVLIPAIFAGISWVGVIMSIIMLRPEGIPTYIFFFSLLFISLFLTLFIFIKNKRRSFMVAFGIVSYLWLRMLELDSYVNLILLIGLLVTTELYFWKK